METMKTTKAVCLDNVTKSYKLYNNHIHRLTSLFNLSKNKKYREFNALHNISFEIEKGDVLGIVGRNGAGKSTLLQLICGTLTPTSGEISVNGRIAALLELGSGFNPEFTGKENIFLNAAVLGIKREEINEKVDAIIEFSGIGDFINRPVKFYSSGMTVRLAFSIATSVSPEILVIDEALSVGDNEFSYKSFSRIEELREKGATILFCSHSLYQVQSICNKAIWLEKGQLIKEGDPDLVTTCYRDSQSIENNKTFNYNDNSTTANRLVPKDNAVDQLQNLKGRITGTSLKINGKDYDDCMAVRSRVDSLEIKVMYKVHEGITPSVAVSFTNRSSEIISGVGSANDQVNAITNSNGEGYFSLEFPSIKLLKGHYRINVVLFCDKGIHVIDHAYSIYEIYVVQTGLEQGFVHLDHNWNVGCI
jgi:ABC-type polysaccharide/polyol phosphate transport system ATPase subunit